MIHTLYRVLILQKKFRSTANWYHRFFTSPIHSSWWLIILWKKFSSLIIIWFKIYRLKRANILFYTLIHHHQHHQLSHLNMYKYRRMGKNLFVSSIPPTPPPPPLHPKDCERKMPTPIHYRFILFQNSQELSTFPCDVTLALMMWLCLFLRFGGNHGGLEVEGGIHLSLVK